MDISQKAIEERVKTTWFYEQGEPHYFEIASRIEIPTIGVDASVAYAENGVGDEASAIMDRGEVVQSPHGNPWWSLLGQHSDGFTADTQIFKDIGSLDTGDTIILHTKAGRSFYVVASTQLMKPDVWKNVLLPLRAGIVLVTCYPERVNTYRIVVMARWLGLDLDNIKANELPQTGLMNYQSASRGTIGGMSINTDHLTPGNWANNPIAPVHQWIGSGRQRDGGAHPGRDDSSGALEASPIQADIVAAVTPIANQTQQVAGQNELQTQKIVSASMQMTAEQARGTDVLGSKLDLLAIGQARQSQEFARAMRDAALLTV